MSVMEINWQDLVPDGVELKARTNTAGKIVAWRVVRSKDGRRLVYPELGDLETAIHAANNPAEYNNAQPLPNMSP